MDAVYKDDSFDDNLHSNCCNDDSMSDGFDTDDGDSDRRCSDDDVVVPGVCLFALLDDDSFDNDGVEDDQGVIDDDDVDNDDCSGRSSNGGINVG